MTTLFAFGADALIFIALPWVVWRLLGRAIPLAVLPILVGLGLAASGLGSTIKGVPSDLGNQIGFVGVLLLAFTAGLEMRQTSTDGAGASVIPQKLSVTRLMTSAAFALALPFAAGTLAAYHYFNELPGWAIQSGENWLGAMAIGLCVAVSALPVLIGLVRELPLRHRSLGQLSLGVAVIDDAVLWICLAVLLLVAGGSDGLSAWAGQEIIAVGTLAAIAGLGGFLAKRGVVPATGIIWAAMPVYLAAGAWASSQLGLHALLGAYFAGVLMPRAWGSRLPVERVGLFSLFILAPLFFGHSGLKIDGDALGWTSLLAAGGLLLLSISTKLIAVLIYPPSHALSIRQSLAVGSLLQCKGLMEIVAATILRDHGLLSENAYAALVTLAVLSTTLTGPLFRLFMWQPGKLDAHIQESTASPCTKRG